MANGVLVLKMFQSNVEMGFKPRPETLPVITARLKLSGFIQVIQLKYESA